MEKSNCEAADDLALLDFGGLIIAENNDGQVISEVCAQILHSGAVMLANSFIPQFCNEVHSIAPMPENKGWDPDNKENSRPGGGPIEMKLVER